MNFAFKCCKDFLDEDKMQQFENNLERKFFYTDYPGRKMVVGKISLNNAMVRLTKNEYYTFVTYHEGDVLLEQYDEYLKEQTSSVKKGR